MIHHDPSTRTFVLHGHSSSYAFRIEESGQLLFLFHGKRLPDQPDFAALNLYTDSSITWDPRECRPLEYAVAGDLSYRTPSLQLCFPEPGVPVKSSEAFQTPLRDARLRFQSYEVSTDACPGLTAAHNLPSSSNSIRETLQILLRDEIYPVDVILNYRISPESDIIERWIEIKNNCGYPIKITRCGFATLNFPTGRYELTRASEGAWAREFHTARTELRQGTYSIGNQGLNTGHEANPFFLLNRVGQACENEGEVWFGALAYSGNWELNFEKLPTGALRVTGGYHPGNFELSLQPSESHTTPAFIIGFSDSGLSGASQKLHRFALDHVLPVIPETEFRPVLYNGWEATYFDLRYENQLRLARIAASIGVELFCVDDGWFGGRRHDHAGLGDWFVSPDLFPNGLKPLADEIHQLGMKFGLWVEPEMVNPDSDLYRAHPDWVLHFPGRIRSEVRNQLMLDFGRPEVVEYIVDLLIKLVAENGIDFFKWDCNRYATEPGSQAGLAYSVRHVEGVYSIMDRLRLNYPHLSIQSCSGGGGRIDYGILQRTDQVWTSDNTDAFQRIAIQDGFSLAYPARAMESWVTHEHNHQTGSVSTVKFRFDCAMRGALGIGSCLDVLEPDELDLYREQIEFYKLIRPIVQGGNLFRLEGLEQHGSSVWQFLSLDRNAAVLSLLTLQHPIGADRPPIVMRNLLPDKTYRISDSAGKSLAECPGWQLISLGVPGDLNTGTGACCRSFTWLLEVI